MLGCTICLNPSKLTVKLYSPDGKLGQQVFAGAVRFCRVFQVRARFDGRDAGVGDDSARRVLDDPIDFSRVHLAKRGRRAKRKYGSQENRCTKNACEILQHQIASTWAQDCCPLLFR